jgi:hypothetical protein
MALHEVTEDTVVQRCANCKRDNRIAIASLTVGVEHGEHRDESLITLPVCPGCSSVEVLRRSADDEGDHPAPGTFGHLHRMLVDHLHAELVRRAQVAPAVRKADGRSAPVLARPLTADAIERWFPRGMKLESPL